MPAADCEIRELLDALRTELSDLAFDLERQGRRDAADVAMMLHARLREIAEERSAAHPFSHSPAVLAGPTTEYPQ